jgi:hypothetical protein
VKYYLLIALSLLLTLAACNNKPVKKIAAKPIFKESPMDTVYAALRPSVQKFDIDNNKASIVKAANGTQILIPANCFVNENDELVTGTISLEIVEAFSLKDFITAGLATMSGNRLLQSNGMMYINAKAGNASLQLGKGAAVSVSMPIMSQNNGFQMFTGDGSNWAVDSSMGEVDYSIPLPLNLLYPQGNRYLWHCLGSYENGKDRWAYYDTSVISFTNPKFDNTIIATEEFRNRVWELTMMTERMSYFVDRDYYFDKVDCFGQKDNLDLFKVYYSFPNRSFRESDSIAKELYIDYFNANEKKMEAFCKEVNEHKRRYYSNWTDTNYYFDFRKVSMKENYMDVLKYFPPNDSKEIKRINDHGVNLNASNAYNLLKAKGVEAKEINEILNYNFRRQAIIGMLQREKDAGADEEKLSKLYQSTLFSVTKMGWINCDRFYEDPSAANAAIYVNNSSNNNLKFIDCSLVIPDMNVRLTAFPFKSDSYSFTKKDGPYTKLPIGKLAVIVGIAIQHDSVFFASQKIRIKDGLQINLPMKYINTSSLKDSLQIALK